MQGGSDSFCASWLSSLPTLIPLTEGLSAAEHIAREYGVLARFQLCFEESGKNRVESAESAGADGKNLGEGVQPAAQGSSET